MPDNPLHIPLIEGYDYPKKGGNWTPKEIAEWRGASRRLMNERYADYLRSQRELQNAVPKKVGRALLPIAKSVGKYFTRVAGAVLAVEGLTNSERPKLLNDRYRLEQALKNLTNAKAGSTTVIYEPGSTIFVEGQTRYIYVPIPPARRLKPLAALPDNQPIGTDPIPAVTVEYSMANRIWGEILHNPVSNEKLSVISFDSGDFYKKISNESRKSERRLAEWLTNDTAITIADQACVFINWFDFDDNKVELDILCGLNQIQTFYDGLLIQSKNAIRPILSEAPKELKYKKTKVKVPSYEEIKFPYENTRGGQANKVSGSIGYPLIVPKDIASGSKDSEMITNNAELGAYLIKMMSQLMGAFPLEIEIDDSDLNKKGNQKQKIVIPNLAEGLGEILALQLNSSVYGQALLNLAVKNIIQSCKNSVGIAVTQDIAKMCADYFGFEYKEVSEKIKLPINPEGFNIEDAIQESTQKYKSYELTDKRDLNDYLMEILQGMAIIKGALYKKFDTDDIKNDIKKYLENLKAQETEADSENWREWLQQVELGFTQYGITNKENPYNRPQQERPQIRDVGEVT